MLPSELRCRRLCVNFGNWVRTIISPSILGQLGKVFPRGIHNSPWNEGVCTCEFSRSCTVIAVVHSTGILWSLQGENHATVICVR
jgi:hypothetical protein